MNVFYDPILLGGVIGFSDQIIFPPCVDFLQNLNGYTSLPNQMICGACTFLKPSTVWCVHLFMLDLFSLAYTAFTLTSPRLLSVQGWIQSVLKAGHHNYIKWLNKCTGLTKGTIRTWTTK